MRYFIYWWIMYSDDRGFEDFTSKESAEKFLNEKRDVKDFKFRVIRGVDCKAEAVVSVTNWEISQ